MTVSAETYCSTGYMKGTRGREQVCEVEPQSSSKIIQHGQGRCFQAMTLKVQQKLCSKVSQGAVP